jgi:hypothetical protein
MLKSAWNPILGHSERGRVLNIFFCGWPSSKSKRNGPPVFAKRQQEFCPTPKLGAESEKRKQLCMPERLAMQSYMVCGTRFDTPPRYTLIKPIGKGAYGVVWSVYAMWFYEVLCVCLRLKG